jgi:isopenicillin N synthase-like dioxygenase
VIPIIDLSTFDPCAPAWDPALLRNVDAAARHLGFMQVTGHGISGHVLHGLHRAMDGFFQQPLAAKQRWRAPSPAINRGYTSPLSERLSYSAGVASAADLFEAFNVGAACSDFAHLSLDAQTYAENIWPADVPGFRQAVQAWFDEAGGLARRLTRLFAVTLGLPAGYFEPYEDHSIDVLRLNHYAMPEGVTRVEPDQMGMGAHTDYGIVTVLWADPVAPGLQVQTPEGGWIDATPQPGALMVNLGDLMARWTGGRWTSSLHRVPPPLDAQGRVIRRRSAAYFHDGNADAVIDTLPTCLDEPGAGHAPITVAEHLRRKLAGSRGLHLNEAAAQESARILRGQQPGEPG